jgi:hypothetical protein
VRSFVAGAWASVIVLLIVGCGGGGGSVSNVSTTSAIISKAEYVKRADAICSRTEKEQLKLLGSLPKLKPTQKSQVELVEHAGIPPLQEQAKELTKLPEPSEGAAEAKAYVIAFSNGLEKSEEDPSAMLKSTPFASAEAIAAKFGFKVCAGS